MLYCVKMVIGKGQISTEERQENNFLKDFTLSYTNIFVFPTKLYV